jgi:alkylation response protein AidB-like acyl-CoA dehydrogenase
VTRKLDELAQLARRAGERAAMLDGLDETSAAHAALAIVREAGLTAWTVPRRDGGADAGELADPSRVSVRALCAIRSELAYHSGMLDVMFVMQGLGSYPLALGAQPKLRGEILREVARGERIAAFALTEPDAGSSLNEVATRAERSKRGWTLNGHKTFISNAGIAGFYTVLARTAPPSAPSQSSSPPSSKRSSAHSESSPSRSSSESSKSRKSSRASESSSSNEVTASASSNASTASNTPSALTESSSSASTASSSSMFRSDSGAHTMFFVPADARGLEITRFEVTAPHPIGDVRFNDVDVPDAHRLGEVGSGLELALATLGCFRVSVAAAANGFARRAFDESCARLSTRHQFGKPLASFQSLRFDVAEMDTRLRAAELLVREAAEAVDAGDKAVKEVARAKLFATENASWICDRAVQHFGGLGVKRGSIVERLWREVRALRIYEGTSEIQKLVLAKEIFARES